MTARDPLKGCRGKRRHRTEAAAVEAARLLRASEAIQRGEDMRRKAMAYGCEACRGWHVGHRRIRLQPA